MGNESSAEDVSDLNKNKRPPLERNASYIHCKTLKARRGLRAFNRSIGSVVRKNRMRVLSGSSEEEKKKVAIRIFKVDTHKKVDGHQVLQKAEKRWKTKKFLEQENRAEAPWTSTTHQKASQPKTMLIHNRKSSTVMELPTQLANGRNDKMMESKTEAGRNERRLVQQMSLPISAMTTCNNSEEKHYQSRTQSDRPRGTIWADPLSHPDRERKYMEIIDRPRHEERKQEQLNHSHRWARDKQWASDNSLNQYKAHRKVNRRMLSSNV